jgi:hypothetical protein
MSEGCREMQLAALRAIEVLAVGVAAAPLVRLEWWAFFVTLPALAVAFAADAALRAAPERS